ncbi:MAG: phenylacetate--CoA ligase family protein [Gammaproteobacteria bacterium]|nr:phenylacetate--CoA ligase family protein [Gammaproteobacteria bacterium]
MSKIRTVVDYIDWPSLPSTRGAVLIASLYQLEQSQWWPLSQIHECQLRQIKMLFQHASQTVPYYKEYLKGFDGNFDVALIKSKWSSLPVISREELQRAGEAMWAKTLPPSHGEKHPLQTSGSTGRPVTAYTTEVTRFFYDAMTLREHNWHDREFNTKLLAIRPENKIPANECQLLPVWGGPASEVYQTGPAGAINSCTDIKIQAQLLCEQDPGYFLSLPSNIKALAHYFMNEGMTLPRLKQVRSYGEIADDELRELCQLAWGVPLIDVYSSQEIGHIALQCPEEGHYHTMSETVLVEVLDENNNPCQPGETGKVVVTCLHNFAMPLIRYAIGDYAEVGEPCPCGRGLPVLKRVMGRQRNMLLLPDGKQHWPSFPAERWTAIAPVRQFQIIQKSLQDIKVRLVVERPLNESEIKGLEEMLVARLSHPFNIAFDFTDTIERSKAGKFEDFVSEIA